MQKIEHILFPVDLSESCRRMAPMVRSLACRTGARLTLLNVLELPPSYHANRSAFLALVDVNGLLREHRKTFRQFLRAELDDLPGLRRVSRHGEPASIIVEYASRHGVSLIMMPSHGVSPFRRLLIGSVTAKVLHDAQCPVWTSAHVEDQSFASPFRLARILCAVDLADGSVTAVEYAGGFAKTFGAQLRLVHVVPSTAEFAVNYCDAEFVTALSEEAREQLRQMREKAGVSGDGVIRTGKVPDAIRAEALEWNADLIVIGRGVLGKALGRLRTHTYAIIRESPCPVISG
jgi:nucleotide-binding universal stress UspA family protein